MFVESLALSALEISYNDDENLSQIEKVINIEILILDIFFDREIKLIRWSKNCSEVIRTYNVNLNIKKF